MVAERAGEQGRRTSWSWAITAWSSARTSVARGRGAARRGRAPPGWPAPGGQQPPAMPPPSRTRPSPTAPSSRPHAGAGAAAAAAAPARDRSIPTTSSSLARPPAAPPWDQSPPSCCSAGCWRAARRGHWRQRRRARLVPGSGAGARAGGGRPALPHRGRRGRADELGRRAVPAGAGALARPLAAADARKQMPRATGVAPAGFRSRGRGCNVRAQPSHRAQRTGANMRLTPKVKEILSWYESDNPGREDQPRPAADARPARRLRQAGDPAGRPGLRARAGAQLRAQPRRLRPALPVRAGDRGRALGLRGAARAARAWVPSPMPARCR